MANRRHVPTPPMRSQCAAYATVGTPHHTIAKLLGIDTRTLLKHYAEELELGKARATAAVGASLYKMATGARPNVTAAIFWMKAQAGWRDRDPGDTPPLGPVTFVFDDPTRRPKGYDRKRRAAPAAA